MLTSLPSTQHISIGRVSPSPLAPREEEELSRDHLTIRLWKAVKVLFTYVAPEQELPIVEDEDYVQFREVREGGCG